MYRANVLAGPPRDCRDLIPVPFFDRNFCQTVSDRPVDSGGRQRHIERHIVVFRGQRLEIGADFVGDIAASGRAIRAGDADIDESVLHQVPAGVVNDQRVRHLVFCQFPGRQLRPLIARPSLVYPHVYIDALVPGEIYRCGRGAPIDGGERTGIAVRQNIDRITRLSGGNFLDQFKPLYADTPRDFDVLVTYISGFLLQGALYLFGIRCASQRIEDPLNGPTEIEGEIAEIAEIVKRLPEKDRNLIDAVYNRNMTCSAAEKELGIPGRMTALHDEIRAAL